MDDIADNGGSRGGDDGDDGRSLLDDLADHDGKDVPPERTLLDDIAAQQSPEDELDDELEAGPPGAPEAPAERPWQSRPAAPPPPPPLSPRLSQDAASTGGDAAASLRRRVEELAANTAERKAKADEAQEAEALKQELRNCTPGGLSTMTTVGLHNLCDMKLVDLEDWPHFYEDMCIDVEKECRKHGQTVKTWVDKTAPFSTVFVRFVAPQMALQCQRAMDNRCFAGRLVVAELCDNSIWAERSD